MGLRPLPCQRRRPGGRRPDVRGHRGVRPGPVAGRTGDRTESESYRPQPVRRVFIPKPDGKQRPLGIRTIRDRVAQMAVVLVLEPIFEADLEPEQYAYRANRSALDAVRRSTGWSTRGIPRSSTPTCRATSTASRTPNSLKSLSRRISDRHLLGLIKVWLETPVEEIDERGRHHRTTRSKDEGRGTPQGSPLSPLLSNVYMRRFVRGWKTLGHERRLQAVVVNYADDFVICCRGTADEAMAAMRGMMSRLKLTVNEAKTRLCRVPEESFDFLGYTIGRCHSPRTGRAYIGTTPSAKKIAAPPGRDPRSDRPAVAMDGGRGARGSTEPEASGLVELLLPRPGEPRPTVPSIGTLPAAPPVVVRQAQGEEPGDVTIPRPAPVRGTGAGSPERPDARLPVGERVSSCPRAGCGKSARPVR